MLSTKTLAEHLEYLESMVRLKLFFIHGYAVAHPEEPFREILRNRVDIYRKTDFNRGLLNPAIEELRFDDPCWRKVEARLEALFRRSGADRAWFEQEGYEVLRESVELRAPRDWVDVSRIANYQCGSLRYNCFAPGSRVDTIPFHIANALQPDSIFREPGYLACCLVELMRQTEERYGSTELQTCSWLNQLPRFLDYFPEEYRLNRQTPLTQIKWHYGFWGQFITARGTFNHKYARILRNTGRFPYLPCQTSCSFVALRRHLKQRFNVDYYKAF